MPPCRSAGSRAKEAESQKKLSVSLEHTEGSSAGVERRGSLGALPGANGDMKGFLEQRREGPSTREGHPVVGAKHLGWSGQEQSCIGVSSEVETWRQGEEAVPACPQKASSCGSSAATTGQNWPQLVCVAQGPRWQQWSRVCQVTPARLPCRCLHHGLSRAVGGRCHWLLCPAGPAGGLPCHTPRPWAGMSQPDLVQSEAAGAAGPSRAQRLV